MYKSKKNRLKAVVAFAVALAFVMPVAAVANLGMIGVTSNGENISDMESMVEPTNNDKTEDTVVVLTDINAKFDDTGDPTLGFPPAGWTILDLGNATGDTWELSTVSHSGSYSACVEWGGIMELQDEWLITPEITLPSGSPSMEFWHYWDFSDYDTDDNYLNISTDGGSTWTVLGQWFDPDDYMWYYWTYDLSDYAGMEHVKFAWQYVSTGGENWYIDDIDIAGVIVEGFEPVPRTIYVDDDAAPGGDGTPEHPFQYIQDGINDAISGFDSIYVLNGTYNEYVTVNKQLDLVGESRENVIVDCGTYYGNVVDVTVDGVSIDSFTTMNGEIGILANQHSTTIINCNISGTSRYGIKTKASGNSITNCNVYDNNAQGIYFNPDGSSNSITNCNVYDNTNGIKLAGNKGSVVVTDCNVYNNSRMGIYLYKVKGYVLSGNAIYGNTPDFVITGTAINEFNHDIDDTNMINGKPMCYIVGENDLVLDGLVNDFGFLGLISCTNITAKNADVGGILVVNTTDSTISNVNSYNAQCGYSLYIHSKKTVAERGGILLFDSSNNDFIDCDTYDNGRNGIVLFSSSNNNFTNCDAYNNAERGINLFHGSNSNNFTNCDAYNNVYYGIDLDDHTISSDNLDNVIMDCDVYNNSKDGIRLDTASGTIITNCNVYNNTKEISGLGTDYSGIKVFNSLGTIITNCKVYNHTQYGMHILKSSNCELSGNVIYDNVYNFGVESAGYTPDMAHFDHYIDPTNTIHGKRIYYFVDDHDKTFDGTEYNFGYLALISCTNITAKNADVYGILMLNTIDSTISNVGVHNTIEGIYLWMTSNIDIINCDIYNNDNVGIRFTDSSNSKITNCDVHNNNVQGIGLLYSNNINITNCNTYDNLAYANLGQHHSYGIYIKGSSNNNITNCDIYNNFGDQQGYGIYLSESSDNNTITDCDIYGHRSYGIYIPSGTDNLMYHNNIANNLMGNAMSSSSNTWDDGYPSGGNFWSDYTGDDEYSGPGQNISGSDGIGDTPYIILGVGNNQDNYPLMSLWDETPPVITNVQAIPSSAKPGEPVNITCAVTDNLDLVDTVKVNISGPEGFTLEVTMNKDEGSSYHYEDTYATMGIYYYYIWANDTSGNNATSDVYHFIIGEEDPPEISDVALMTSDPIDTSLPDNPPGFIGGWENTSCTVIDTGIGVNQVKLIVTYKTTTAEYPMTNIPNTDTYYYNMTLTQPGNYTYRIWADDISGNNATSSPEPFALPPNWDVDMDGRTYSNDLMRILWTYTDTGPKGWSREDIDNNGQVYSNDLMNVLWHYAERWWT